MNRRSFVSLAALSGVTALGAPLISPRRAQAGACMTPGFMPRYLSASGVTIGPGGGILLGLEPSGGRDPSADPFAGAYTLTQGETALDLRHVNVAPGLVLLVPPRFVAGAYTVRGPAGELAVRVSDRATPPPSPCAVERIDVSRDPGSQEPYFPPTWGLMAHLRAPIASGIVGVLVAPEATPSPYMLFARAEAGSRSAQLYRSPGRCSPSVPNENPPSPGSVVRLALVSAAGTISVRSNHVSVRE